MLRTIYLTDFIALNCPLAGELMKMNTKAIAVLASLALLAATPVLAADMAARAHAPAPVPVGDPPVNWTGFYLGGNAGGAWATTSDNNAFFAASTGDFHISGAVGGAQVGYNYQIARWVLGIESDYDLSNVKGSTSTGLCAGVVCTVESTWVGTTRGRVGYAIGSWLPFVSGGVSYGNVHIQDSAGAVHAGTTRAGWTGGGGIEYALNRNWSVRAEYLYVDLGSAGVPCTVAAGSCGMSTQTFNESIVRGVLNFRF
jgi:outer membrane immunogenic protein